MWKSLDIVNHWKSKVSAQSKTKLTAISISRILRREPYNKKEKKKKNTTRNVPIESHSEISKVEEICLNMTSKVKS